MMSKPSILIVDDNDGFRQSVAFMLGSSLYSIQQFDCAETVIDTLDSFTDDDDVCMLLDVRMPGLSGLDLHDKVNLSQPDLPIIYMTGHADVPLAVEAMKKGAVTLLEKPLDPVVLKIAVDTALSKRADKRRETANEPEASTEVSYKPLNAVSGEFQCKMESLTPREADVLENLVKGMGNKESAFELNISVRTVEVHRARILRKMQVRTGAELIRFVLMHRASQ